MKISKKCSNISMLIFRIPGSIIKSSAHSLTEGKRKSRLHTVGTQWYVNGSFILG